MDVELLIASIDRAGDHGIVVGILFGAVLVGGLGYGLFQLVSSRVTRGRSERGEGPRA